MKKQILLAMVVISSLGSTSFAKDNSKAQSPRNLIVAKFLKEANTPNSNIAKKLQEVREDLSNGLSSGDEVIPKHLKTSDLQMVVTERSTYLGRFEGDENDGEVVGAYDNWSVEILVTARSLSYYGRITEVSTVPFKCDLESAQGQKTVITCSVK